MNIAYANYKQFPVETPDLKKPILIARSDIGEIAPFVLETINNELILRVYGRSDLGIPITLMNEFLWLYIDELLPQTIN